MEHMSVSFTRDIMTGYKYCIHPSWGYAGIEVDIVKVTGIFDYDYVCIEDGVVAFMDAALQGDEDLGREPEASLKGQVWIRYQYDDGETCYLPLEVFANHISQC